MNVVENNPYRYLGVYSNSPTKERVANQGKIKAFLNVGKPVSFPLDLSNLLPPIERTDENVADAISKLTLPADQLKFAQFWWMKATPVDNIAFNHLLCGNTAMAQSVWGKKDDASSLQNRIVLALIQEDYTTAISCAENLYNNYASSFVIAIAGSDTTTDGFALAHSFLDALIVDGLDIQKLLPYITDAEWKAYVAEKAITPLIGSITQAVATAQASRGKGPEARYKAGQKLMTSTKSALSKLKSLISTTDIRYTTIADKLGTEILQCGIDYFNGTSDDDAVQKAMSLQKYAQSVVVGKMAKDRCDQNVNILKKIEKEYPVRKELERISIRIKDLGKLFVTSGNFSFPSGTVSAGTIQAYVNDSKGDLASIKQKLGVSDPLYVKVSSAFVGAVVNTLVGIVNWQQMINSESARNEIFKASTIMSQISNFEMDTKTRNYLNTNYTTLKTICSQLKERDSEGCYIATMVYGDYNHPQVLALREFRDSYLSKRKWGIFFINYYYKYSPELAEKLKSYSFINRLIRKILDQFVIIIKKCEK